MHPTGCLCAAAVLCLPAVCGGVRCCRNFFNPTYVERERERERRKRERKSIVREIVINPKACDRFVFIFKVPAK